MIVRIYNVDNDYIAEQHCKDLKDVRAFRLNFCAHKMLQDKDMVIRDNVLYILAVPFSKEYNYKNLIPAIFKELIEKGN